MKEKGEPALKCLSAFFLCGFSLKLNGQREWFPKLSVEF